MRKVTLGARRQRVAAQLRERRNREEEVKASLSATTTRPVWPDRRRDRHRHGSTSHQSSPSCPAISTRTDADLDPRQRRRGRGIGSRRRYLASKCRGTRTTSSPWRATKARRFSSTAVTLANGSGTSFGTPSCSLRGRRPNRVRNVLRQGNGRLRRPAGAGRRRRIDHGAGVLFRLSPLYARAKDHDQQQTRTKAIRKVRLPPRNAERECDGFCARASRPVHLVLNLVENRGTASISLRATCGRKCSGGIGLRPMRRPRPGRLPEEGERRGTS